MHHPTEFYFFRFFLKNQITVAQKENFHAELKKETREEIVQKTKAEMRLLWAKIRKMWDHELEVILCVLVFIFFCIFLGLVIFCQMEFLCMVTGEESFKKDELKSG